MSVVFKSVCDFCQTASDETEASFSDADIDAAVPNGWSILTVITSFPSGDADAPDCRWLGLVERFQTTALACPSCLFSLKPLNDLINDRLQERAREIDEIRSRGIATDLPSFESKADAGTWTATIGDLVLGMRFGDPRESSKVQSEIAWQVWLLAAPKPGDPREVVCRAIDGSAEFTFVVRYEDRVRAPAARAEVTDGVAHADG